jgi:hypothetical protein
MNRDEGSVASVPAYLRMTSAPPDVPEGILSEPSTNDRLPRHIPIGIR